MSLPNYLLNKIENELNKYPLKEVRDAYDSMSNFYRKDRNQIHLSLDTPEKRCAYIAARMPATFSVVQDVLQELHLKDECQTILDIGAGCGTASFAACEVLSNIKTITAFEQNIEMIKLGKNLASEHPILKNTNWCNDSIVNQNIEFPKTDLVIVSYALNEIPNQLQKNLVEKLWNSANKYLVLIEPGTMESFHLIHSVRELFVANSNNILAPCAHANVCPAFASQDLCHFSSRVERTSFHRYLKHAERGFEDEKYSYLILTKIPKENYVARIVRKPMQRSGFISFKLCTKNGFITKSYSKKDKEVYKTLKDFEYGHKLKEDVFSLI